MFFQRRNEEKRKNGEGGLRLPGMMFRRTTRKSLAWYFSARGVLVRERVCSRGRMERARSCNRWATVFPASTPSTVAHPWALHGIQGHQLYVVYCIYFIH